MVTACGSQMPTSKNRSGYAAWNLLRPVPVGMPAVIATIRWSARAASISSPTKYAVKFGGLGDFGTAVAGGASSEMDSVGRALDRGEAAAAAGGVWVAPFVGRASIGGSAAPWNPTWSISAGRYPRPLRVRT